MSAANGLVTIFAGRYGRLTFEVTPPAGSRPGLVDFFIDGRRVWVEHNAPYYLYGNDGDRLHNWSTAQVIWGRDFTVEALVAGRRLTARVRLNR